MIKELDYQTKAVDELVEKCAKLLQIGGERRKLVFKAPTGAGKTVMASLLLERLPLLLEPQCQPWGQLAQ